MLVAGDVYAVEVLDVPHYFPSPRPDPSIEYFSGRDYKSERRFVILMGHLHTERWRRHLLLLLVFSLSFLSLPPQPPITLPLHAKAQLRPRLLGLGWGGAGRGGYDMI